MRWGRVTLPRSLPPSGSVWVLEKAELSPLVDGLGEEPHKSLRLQSSCAPALFSGPLDQESLPPLVPRTWATGHGWDRVEHRCPGPLPSACAKGSSTSDPSLASKQLPLDTLGLT